jgi:small subunit ribosomal protein S17
VPEKKAATKKTTAARPTARKATATKAVAAKPAARRVARKAAAPAATAAVAEAPRAHRGRRKMRVGRVVSAKTPKTVIVEIERLREHPLYKKTIRVRKRVPAHDPSGDVKAGDLVRIQESRPFSATKRWQVSEVLSRAGEAYAAAPRVEEIEKALEETEGVTELLSKPEREIVEAAAEETETEGAEAKPT